MPTPWHYHHHASLMRYYIFDHEQFLIAPCSSLPFTLVQFDLCLFCPQDVVPEHILDVWQTLIWPSNFRGSPMVSIFWWALCHHGGEVFTWFLTLTKAGGWILKSFGEYYLLTFRTHWTSVTIQWLKRKRHKWDNQMTGGWLNRFIKNKELVVREAMSQSAPRQPAAAAGRESKSPLPLRERLWPIN